MNGILPIPPYGGIQEGWDFGIIAPMKNRLFPFFALVCHVAMAGTGDVMRCIAEIQDALDRNLADRTYEVTAQIVQPGIPGKYEFTAQDGSGALRFGVNRAITHQCPTNAGDIVRICGKTLAVIPGVSQRAHPSQRSIGADCLKITRVGHAPPPKPLDVSGKDFYARTELRNRLVRINGIVHDVFRDEIDPKHVFVILDCGDTIVYIAFPDENLSDDYMNKLVGSTVAAIGVAVDNIPGCRKRLGRILSVRGLDAIGVMSSSDGNPFTVPELSRSFFPHTMRPVVLDRRRISGHVIAVWNKAERILLRTAAGDLVRAELKPQPPPQYGDHIEMAGVPETDLYRINLSRAIWRKTSGPAFLEEAACPIALPEIWINSVGLPYKNVWFHGHAVRLRGIVRTLPTLDAESGRMYIESDSFIVAVDASACPKALDGVTIGCTVEVDGTYITETDIWYPSCVFPHVRDIIIAVRTPKDIRITAYPPWWTPQRLFMLVGVLLAVVFGIFAWNVALHRRAERRGKELAAEQLDNVTSRLKVYERTHLAVDLHDSLSQTLTGVSMGIGSAMDSIGAGETALRQRLGLVARMVEACRTELRNCLWDLRNQALEEESMERAIRLSLAQILDRTSLHVRFNVPRARLSDNTAHAILRIVRELAANAIRHGRASSIWIVGSIENGMLRFSVRDDGVGFDPALAPGVAEGHFGLQGIRERIERFEGLLKVASRPGEGTKVTVAISVPPEMPSEEGRNV